MIRHYSDALVVVDSISSMGSVSIPFDKLGIDILIGVTQKGLMSPPGMSIIVASDKALQESRRKSNFGSVAFNYSKAHSLAENMQTLTTPSLHAFWGLEHALSMMKDISFERVFQHHCDVANHSRILAVQNRFTLFAQSGYQSDTITALKVEGGMRATAMAQRLSANHGITVGVGNGEFTDSIIRIAHMGHVSEREISQVYSALNETLIN